MGAENLQAREDRLVGTVIQDRFLVLQRIAAGGMGVVYKAEQVPLGRSVALKILESKHNEEIDSHFSERFFLEAAAVAKLSHPNTIVLYDYGRTDDSLYYYAMEYVDGVTLTKRIFDGGPLAPRDGIHVALQICGSLREAHEHGMVHRDLKPGNVMLTEKGGDPSFVKVLDFGLVKVMGQDVGVELTKSGMLMGSPRYMAPEQVTGRPIDRRADIYSLGSVLYHALTGAPPFQQESQYEVLRAQVELAPPPLRATVPECRASARLEALVMRCLEKNKERRPQTMNELAIELAACAREVGLDDVAIASSCRPLPTASQEMPSVSVSVSSASTTGPLESSSLSMSPQAALDPAMSAPPGTPSKLLPMVGLFVVVGLAAGALAFLIPTREEDPAPSPPSIAEAPAPDEPEEHEASGERAAPAPVRLASEPPGARVRRDDEDLGDAPVTLQIPPGERWDVRLSLEGYEDRTVTVSAGRGELHVRLRPVAAPEEPVAARSGGRRRGRGGAAEAVAGSEAAEDSTSATEEISTSGAGSDTTSETRPEDGWGRGNRTDNRDPWAQ